MDDGGPTWLEPISVLNIILSKHVFLKRRTYLNRMKYIICFFFYCFLVLKGSFQNSNNGVHLTQGQLTFIWTSGGSISYRPISVLRYNVYFERNITNLHFLKPKLSFFLNSKNGMHLTIGNWPLGICKTCDFPSPIDRRF